MKVRYAFLLFGASLLAATAACGPVANASTRYDCLVGSAVAGSGNGLATVHDTQAVFSLDGGPPSGPSAINTCTPTPVQAVPGSFFDVAIDIQGTQAYALPPHAVSSAGAAGLDTTTQTWDQVTEAPASGYNDSTALAIGPGTVFLVQAQPRNCQLLPYQNQRFLYSKILIDSIHYYPFNAVTAPSGLTVYYEILVDPVCGYRSLAPGIPPS